MIYLFLAALIFCIDEAFKNRIEKKPDSEFPASLKHGIYLEKHHNYGFSLNKNDDKPWLVQLISVLVMIPLTIWAAWLFFTRGGKKGGIFTRLMGKLGASFLLGGAASNLYDRLNRGYVVDYIRFPNCRIKKIRHIIFNIADFFLFMGAALSVLYGLLQD